MQLKFLRFQMLFFFLLYSCESKTRRLSEMQFIAHELNHQILISTERGGDSLKMIINEQEIASLRKSLEGSDFYLVTQDENNNYDPTLDKKKVIMAKKIWIFDKLSEYKYEIWPRCKLDK